MSNDPDRHQLLAVVAPVHHQRVGQALDDGTLGLAEALDGVAAGGVRHVDRLPDLDVVCEGDVADLDVFVAPFVEELRGADLVGHVFGQDGVGLGLLLDFHFAV